MLTVGGSGQGGVPLASAELYTPASGSWSNTGSLTVARTSHAAVLLPTGLALILGGSGGPAGILASSELYASAVP